MALNFSGFQQGKNEGRPLQNLDLGPLADLAKNTMGDLGEAWDKFGPQKDAYYKPKDQVGFTDEERDNMDEVDWVDFGTNMMSDKKKSGFGGLMQRAMPWGKTGYEESNSYNAQNLKDMHSAITSGSDRLDMLRTDRITPEMVQSMYDANAIDEDTFDLYNAQNSGVDKMKITRENLGIDELDDNVETIGNETQASLPGVKQASSWLDSKWANPFGIGR
tara:strand:- start:1012 stop:1668 length:657 start_codon:yes stop_codon:yes gene_type:complete